MSVELVTGTYWAYKNDLCGRNIILIIITTVDSFNILIHIREH